ncbi:MAG TPA: hypothetical protein VFY93_09750 [Planctomycetota bacterium]|nr:hypothetical protein [Planctomycetota bacterium]
MRAFVTTLVVAALLGGPRIASAADQATVRDEASNFEISLPPGKEGDWDKIEDKERKDIKAHFKTEFVDTEPLATAEVQVIIFPMNRDLAARSLESIAKQWSSAMEGSLANPRDGAEGKTTLGGQEAYFRDIKGDLVAGSGLGHVTWHITRMGKSFYILHVVRTHKAVGDTGLEEEIGKIRDSFKFLKIEEVKPDPKAKKGEGPGGPAGAAAGSEKEKGPDPEQLARAEMKLDYWLLKFVKPEGLLNTPPEKLDESEKANHCVAKFNRSVDQSSVLVRIYAQNEKNQQFTIEQLAERSLKSFKETFNEKSRLPEEVDKDYKKFPGAKDAIRLKLVGRRNTPEVIYWYLAQCKNGRQYQIEIHFWGGEAEKFYKVQIDDFMKNLRPQDD